MCTSLDYFEKISSFDPWEKINAIISILQMNIGKLAILRLWRRGLQPLLYAAYSLFLDYNGTIARQTAGAFMDVFLGYEPSDLTYIMYDKYELALQRGEAFNFFDYAEYFS
ncbi:MAG: hypothetical protein ACFFFG_14960 [Candidatus Thorarchaeota archaeon]